MTEVITLWRPTGQAELDLVAASGWRAWPPRLPDQPIFYPVLNRWYATKIAREWNVPAGGVGYVTRFDVDAGYLGRYDVRQAGGRDVLEYWIPAEHLDEFNAHIVGAIVEVAAYRAPVADAEFEAAATALGRPLPADWRAYLQGESWLHHGWIGGESEGSDVGSAFLSLYPPSETVDLVGAWAGAVDSHPGVAIIGGDGGREHIVLDLSRDPSPVLTVDITSAGWDDAIVQADGAGQFVAAVEAGTFVFRRSG